MGSHQSTLAAAGHNMWRLAFSLSAVLMVRALHIDINNQAEILEGGESRDGRQLESVNDVLSPLLIPPLGTPCQTKDGTSGLCMSLKSCYPYFKIADFGTRDTWVMGLYDTCSYQSPQGREVFGVCCNNTLPAEIPEEPVSTTKVDEESNALVEEFPLQDAVARRNCGFRSIRPQVTLYSQSPNTAPFLYHQPIAQPYIVNGVEAIPHEFPFMAALMNRNRQFCGGSLIDEKHVLTAAHCVAHMSKFDVQNLRVRLGDHNIRSTSDGPNAEKRVKRVIRHKGFSSTTLWNDVAILTLDEEVQTTKNIQNICLASDTGENFKGQEVTVAGWGTLSEGGSQPASLMKVDVKVWANERCRRSYGSSAPGGITKHMLCAGDTNKDSCSGDSGGPLFICRGTCTQIGIVSWGIGCAKAQYPGVYTRVTEMMPWIRRIVKEY